MTSAPNQPKHDRIVRISGAEPQFPDNPARAHGHKNQFSPLSITGQAEPPRAREQDCQDFTPTSDPLRPRGLYRTGLPTGGRQWSWSSSDPLVKLSVRLPASLVAMVDEAAKWRDIPSTSVIRRAFEIGLPILIDRIEQEDAEKAKAE